jgi:hypothetical protein
MIYRRNLDVNARDTYVITDIQASSVADKIVGICPVRSQLVAVKEVHGTAGSDGSAVTLAVERLQGTETSGNGDSVATGINLKGTANTVQSGTLTTTASTLIFEAGDRVGLDVTGTTTALANMIVVMQFRPVDA